MVAKLDHDLLDKFLGFVLDGYKSEEKGKDDAIGDIAHLIAAIDQRSDDPNAYMKAVMEQSD